MRKDVEQLWNLVEPAVTGVGLELVELQWSREPEGWVLRVFIDRAEPPHLPGQAPADHEVLGAVGVSHDDCERVSRDLSAALDVADVISHAYRLEVSSPGIDRPLRRERDFQRYSGQKAKLKTVEAVEGRRNFSGILRGAHGGVVDIEADGRSYQVPIGVIAKANLVPDWDAEFRKAQSRSAQ